MLLLSFSRFAVRKTLDNSIIATCALDGKSVVLIEGKNNFLHKGCRYVKKIRQMCKKIRKWILPLPQVL